MDIYEYLFLLTVFSGGFAIVAILQHYYAVRQLEKMRTRYDYAPTYTRAGDEFVVCDTCGRDTDKTIMREGLCPVCDRYFKISGGK